MKHQHVKAVHSSRGPVGSVYSTTDGQFYVRTPWGTVKVDNNAIGISIDQMQQRHDWYQKRFRTTVTKMAGAFLVGFVAGVVTLLLL